MADVRIIDLDIGSVNDSHLFESDDGSSSFKVTAIDLRSYCQNGLTPQSIGIAAGVTTTELNYLDGVTSGVQGQIDAKAPINNPIFTGTVSGITKAMVGLPFVDNTSDANKPISTLQQAGLDGKVSTSITINTASGLTGGGSLVSNRTISLDVPSLTNKTTPSSSDQVLIYDPVSSSHKRTTVSGITSGLSGGAGVTVHGALTGLSNDDHPQYSLANGTRWTVTPTANRVVISTASGVLSSSSVTTTELSYLSGVTSLIQGQINNKTDSGHTHTIANINNLQADLNTKAVTSRVVATASGLTGGGDLSNDRTIALNISALQSKTNPSILDEVLIYDPVSLSHKKTTVSGITGYSGGGSPTITTLTDAATVTPNVDTTTIGILTSLSQNTTIANPIGTPTNYQELVIRISSSSIMRIFWGTSYNGLLPNTTSGGDREDYFHFRYNTLDTKWDLTATNQRSDEVELSYLTSSLILTGNL